MEINPDDARDMGVGEGDLVRVEAPRRVVRGRARVSAIRQGVVFVPFHYGYWDDPACADAGRTRAANELTMTAWDPVSKQPIYKVAAVRLVKEADGDGAYAPAPTVGGSAPAVPGMPATVGGPGAESTVRGQED